MKILLLLIFLNLSASYCQVNVGNILYPSDSSIYLKDFYPISFNNVKEIFDSLQISNEDKEAFYDCYFKKEEQKLQTEFYKYDLSGDGLNDLIYNGYLCGQEERFLMVWINTGKNYYESARSFGNILKAIPNYKNKTVALVTSKGFCCDNYSGQIILNVPTYINGQIKYKISEEINEYVNIQLPKNKTNPIKFEVKNEESNLRSSPINIEGNTLVKYMKGSKGVAIGSEYDKFGIEWLFVIIDGNAPFTYNRLSKDNNQKKCGWMVKNELKIYK